MNMLSKISVKKSIYLAATLLGLGNIQSSFAETLAKKQVTTMESFKALNPAAITIKDSASFDIKDKKTNQIYRIFISVPNTPAPPSGYPIIFVMDGNDLFNITHDVLRAYEKRFDLVKKTHPILVGIEYPDSAEVAQLRTYDLTPPQNTKISMKFKTGGAEVFSVFIQDQLKPLIAQHFPVDLKHQALMGHSFGGLFTLYNFVYHPNNYQIYIAASPSLWLDPQMIHHQWTYLDQRKALFAQNHTILAMSVGTYEQAIAPYWNNNPKLEQIKQHLAAKQQVDHIHQACKTLKQITDLTVDCIDFDGEDHGSVIPAAIGRGIAIIMRGFAQ